MSILIKGMKMPENCWEDDCPCLNKQYGFCQADDDKGFVYSNKPGWCPLIPVPPHGRLGDLDDFAKRIKNLVEQAETDGFDLGAKWYSVFVRHIELTPTIIPAEEGK